MGTVEDVQFADDNTLRELRAVRDAGFRDAAIGTAASANELHVVLQRAQGAVRSELRLLQQVEAKLNEMEQEAMAHALRKGAGEYAGGPPAPPPKVPTYSLADVGRPDTASRVEVSYGADPHLNVGCAPVMPRSQQDLVFRRAAKRHGRF
jgi:hypothetical protein